MVRFSIGAPTIFAASWTVVLLENQSTCSKFTATFGTGLLTHIERCDVSSRKTPMIFPENSDGVPLRMMGFGWVPMQIGAFARVLKGFIRIPIETDIVFQRAFSPSFGTLGSVLGN